MRLILSLIIFLIPLQALAGSWRVVPIRLFLSPASRNDSVTLINSGDAPLNLQVSAALWTQTADGEDQYQPSDELIFFPRVLTVPAGEERILRAGIKRPPLDQERTFRLFIEEIPEAKSEGNSAVQIAVRFGLPVFIAPPQAKPVAQIDLLKLENARADVRLSNPGNRHLLPTDLALTGLDDTGQVVFTHPLKPWYLLAGTGRDYSYTMSAEECKKTRTLRFSVGAEALRTSRDFSVGPGACTP